MSLAKAIEAAQLAEAAKFDMLFAADASAAHSRQQSLGSVSSVPLDYPLCGAPTAHVEHRTAHSRLHHL
jgi:alkanesulfonate monooxygenase SsuD/methylene tetrahydromethanopterin reductase-like flavin-dependent oxidoreductase (luciferase family)